MPALLENFRDLIPEDISNIVVLGVAIGMALLHITGIVVFFRAIMETRTPQGAIGWAASLIACPIIAIPAYFFLGRSKFSGYVNARRSGLADTDEQAQQIRNDLIAGDFIVTPEEVDHTALEKMVSLPLTRGNDVTLLVDGEATFDAIIEAIQTATSYILVEFFIVKGDSLGTRLKDALLKKAEEGVSIYFLYDEIGSISLPKSYISELRNAGVDIRPFNTRKGFRNRFQLNFRNHRKIVVIDGKVALVGGHNVGDEYLGLDKKIGPWRDTHVSVEGPVVLATQVAFIEDWRWTTDELLDGLNWKPESAPNANRIALSLPSGPADEFETCALFFLHAINSAQSRIWIASPYFVPDPQIISALQLAALRGVDVRILLPNKADHLMVYLSSFSYLEDTEKAGIRVFRYVPGFLHEKAILVDDNLSAIGTANLDNRSFRLNFEIMMLFDDASFGEEVKKMFEEDFSKSREVSASEYTSRNFFFRFFVRLARLSSPVQ